MVELVKKLQKDYIRLIVKFLFMIHLLKKHNINIDPYKFIDLKSGLQNADFITIHVPLTDETKNLISKRRLSLMKKTL